MAGCWTLTIHLLVLMTTESVKLVKDAGARPLRSRGSGEGACTSPQAWMTTSNWRGNQGTTVWFVLNRDRPLGQGERGENCQARGGGRAVGVCSDSSGQREEWPGFLTPRDAFLKRWHMVYSWYPHSFDICGSFPFSEMVWLPSCLFRIQESPVVQNL